MKRSLVWLIVVATMALLVAYLAGCGNQQSQKQSSGTRQMTDNVQENKGTQASQTTSTSTASQTPPGGTTPPADSLAQAQQAGQEGQPAQQPAEGTQPPAEKKENPLLNPQSLTEQAPAVFRAKIETTKGDFVIEVHRDWAPKGADRFYNLVKNGYYDNNRFFRVIAGFMAQFGLNGDPKVTAAWREAAIQDDRPTKSNTRGMVSFAMAGPNTRTTQLFINYGDNSRLDGQGFAPFGQVMTGMEIVDKLYSGYGEGAPRGSGPSQQRIMQEGNTYLEKDFPKLDYIKKAALVS